MFFEKYKLWKDLRKTSKFVKQTLSGANKDKHQTSGTKSMIQNTRSSLALRMSRILFMFLRLSTCKPH